MALMTVLQGTLVFKVPPVSIWEWQWPPWVTWPSVSNPPGDNAMFRWLASPVPSSPAHSHTPRTGAPNTKLPEGTGAQLSGLGSVCSALVCDHDLTWSF